MTGRCSGCSTRGRSPSRRTRSCGPRPIASRPNCDVAPPKLCLIDDGFPRAFVVGRGPGGATLAVSTGLLRAVRRDELDAVIAHELAHVRSLDVLTQTFAVLLATTLVETSRIGGFLSRALLFVLAPDRGRVHARTAVAEARVRGRSRRGEPSATRTTSPTRSCASTRPPSSSRSRPRPRRSRSTRSTRSRPTGSRGCSAPIPRSPSGSGGCGHSAARATDASGRSARRRRLTPERRKVHPLQAHRPGNAEGDTRSVCPLPELIRRRPTLPGALAPSTIGAGGLNFSVRNGKRCTPAAMTAESVKGGTRPPARHARGDAGRRRFERRSYLQNSIATQTCSKSRPRAISTGQLNTLLCLHRPPINVVVFHGPYSLEVMGSLILRWASRLDAFSGYPVQT